MKISIRKKIIDEGGETARRLPWLLDHPLGIWTFRFLQDVLIYRPRIRELYGRNSQLPLFNSVFFEVRTRCNGGCTFCAASVRSETRKDVIMPQEIYRKVGNELRALNFNGIVAPYVNNDPFLYPHLTDFVSEMRQRLPQAWIQIQTNGNALTVKKAEELIQAGLDELNINHYDDDFLSPLPQPIEEIRNAVLPKFFQTRQLRIGSSPPLSVAPPRGIFVFNVNRRKRDEVLDSRAGSAPNKEAKAEIPRGFCEYPFTQFNITADGRVAQCCADFFFSDQMGNVQNEKIIDIWTGDKFRIVRQNLLKGDRAGLSTCSKCDFCGVKKRPMGVTKVLGLYDFLFFRAKVLTGHGKLNGRSRGLS